MRGHMYIPHYEEHTFETVDVELLDWRGAIPDNVVIESEQDVTIEIPIVAAYEAYEKINACILPEM